MAIKDLTGLLAFFSDGQLRGITASKLRDFVNSVLGVGGTLYTTEEQTQGVTPSWAPLTIFDASIDTKGLAEDLVNGLFTLQSGADGVYAVDASLCMSFPANGTVEIALTLNGGLTPYRSKVDVAANKLQQFTISGTGTLEEGDAIGVGIKGSGSATGTFATAQFRAKR